MKTRKVLVYAAVVLAAVCSGAHAQVYVDVNVAGGGNNGTTWADAYGDLRDALIGAANGTIIWLAEGTYKPGTSTLDSFVIQDQRVELYGGFTNGMATLEERDWVAHPTILSGDLTTPDTPNWGSRGDNAQVIVSAESQGDLVIDGFIIRGAFGGDYAGGIYLNSCARPTIANCVFTDNSANGSAGMHLRKCVNAEVVDCIFSGNQAVGTTSDHGSGALGCASFAGYETYVRRCYFTGNHSAWGGGALYDSGAAWEVHFVNCLVAGNTAPAWSGGFYLRDFSNTLVNCTFSGNSPTALYVQTTPKYLQNCILWGDALEYDTAGGGTISATYTDMDFPFFGGTDGNIRANPVWVTAPAGTWSAAPSYAPATGLTTLTDATATWAANAYVGCTVNPDTNANQRLQFSILSNTATELMVWGDASTVAANGEPYQIHDYQLGEGSPCIDAGNDEGAPTEDIEHSPRPQNAATDMGAYESSATGTVLGVIYVDITAAGAMNGTSWEHAYTNLTDALAVANHEDPDRNKIWVARGVYTPGVIRTATFTPTSEVPLYGGFAGTESTLAQRIVADNPTILSGDLLGNDTANWGGRSDNAYHVITDINYTKQLVIDGFIIRGGNADGGTVYDALGQGGGMVSEGATNLTIRNCVFTDNSAATGGGLYFRTGGKGGAVIQDCIFAANRATENGNDRGSGAVCGQGVDNDVTFDRVLFAGNEAPNSVGGAMYTGNYVWPVDYVNCLIVGNVAGLNGGGLYLRSASSDLVNCTIAFNDPSGVASKECIPESLNSIIWDNVSSELEVLDESFNARYSDIDEVGYAGTDGNLREDPVWVSGLPTATWTAGGVYNRLTGLTTLTRTGGGWAADELAGALVNPDTTQRRQFYIVANTPSTMSVWGDCQSMATIGKTFQVYDYNLSSNSPCVEAGYGRGAPATDIVGVTRPQNDNVDMGAYEFAGTLAITSAVLYVDIDATGGNNGTSWADAFVSLTDALSAATSGKQIWMADGTYVPGVSRSSTFTLKGNVTVYGGFAGTEDSLAQRNPGANLTILSGDVNGDDGADDLTGDTAHRNRIDNTYHVVTGVDNAVLDGVVIAGGYANVQNEADPNGLGGGLYAAGVSPGIQNCVFVNNYAYSGGAAWFDNGSTSGVKRCQFIGNVAEVYGGAVSTFRASPVFERCVFSGQTVKDNGGAFYFNDRDSNPMLINCLVCGNESTSFGGALRIAGAATNITTAVNCTFADNHAGVNNGAVYVRGNVDPSPHEFVALNSIFWGNTSGDAGDQVVADRSGVLDLTYSDVQDGQAGTGNITASPQFIGGVTGSWSTDGTFDVASRRTTLTSAAASWPVGQFAGFTVNPDTQGWRQFRIADNTANQMVVWGDATAMGTNGAAFAIYNYEPLEISPCVDTGSNTGAPTEDINGRKRPQGGGTEMGAFELQGPIELGGYLFIH